MHPFITLALAITSEIIGTISLKFAEGFSRPIPSVIVLVAYASTLYFLSATLKALPIGMVYAVWSRNRWCRHSWSRILERSV